MSTNSSTTSVYESSSSLFYPINLEAATDLSRYYILTQKLSTPYQFKQVKPWDSFDDVINNNLAKLKKFNSKIKNVLAEKQFSWVDLGIHEVDGVVGFVSETCESILSNNGVNVVFSKTPGIEQVGKPNLSVFPESGDTHRPLLVGLHYAYNKFSMISKDDFFTSLLLENYKPNSSNTADYENAVHNLRELCSHMVLNNLRYGYVSTGSYTRFIKRSASKDGYIEFSPAILLQASAPYTIFEAFCAITRQCVFGEDEMNPKNGYYLERDQVSFEFQPETLPEPDIHSLKKNDPVTPGKAKWWRVKRQRGVVFRLKFLKPYQPPLLNTERPFKWGISFGTVVTTPPTKPPGKPNVSNSFPAVFKCCNYSQDDENKEKLQALAVEASMYEYLDWCKVESVPRRYIYGDILGFLKVLALQPIGRPMTPSDITGSTINKMKDAISELHHYKILHNNVSLSSFCIDDDGRVRIIGFSKAKRYHILYEAAIQQEMNIVLDIISEGLEKASSFPDI